MAIDTPDWVRDAVFYQIFPDRFAASPRVHKPGPLEPWDAPPTPHGFKGGDLLGIAERLPYLADLGITALYLTPVFASASNHRYHTYDYLTVDPLLGGNDALRELLDAAHGRGMRVVLDGVFNHTGRGFWPFHHVLETGIASPYLEWFHVDRARLAAGAGLDPYPRSRQVRAPRGGDGRSIERYGYRGWWDLPALPKLDTSQQEVREYLFGVAEHWLRFGIDGWRLDVPTEIDDPDFWATFRARCRAVDPDCYLVGEIWNEAPEWVSGDRFDALMNYPLAEAILGFAAGDHLDPAVVALHHEYRARVRPLDGPAFAAELQRIMGCYDPAVTAVQLNLIDSHDTPRFRTLAGGDRAALRLAVLLQAALPGAPCIYYGDEIGLEGRQDPDNRASFPTDGSHRDDEQLAFTRAVLTLRHAARALRRGSLRVVAAAGGAVAIERGLDGERWIVAVNAAERATRLEPRLAGHSGGVLEPHPLPGWPAPAAGPIRADGRAELIVSARSGVVAQIR